MGKDYYQILGVDKSATQEDIKKAFRKMAHQCHPDKQGGDEAKFKEINEAYQVLGDPKKRSQYDQFGSQFENMQGAGGFHGFEGFRDFSNYAQGFDFDDLGDMMGGIGDMFGFGGGRSRRRKQRGSDLHAIVNLDFEQAVFGVEKEVILEKQVVCDRCSGAGNEPGSQVEACKTCGGRGSVRKIQQTILGSMQVEMPCRDCSGEGKIFSQACQKCHGHGSVKDKVNLKVRIPAGIDHGQSIRLAGQGEAGPKGVPAGDLFLKIHVNHSDKFERDGFNLLSQAVISFTQAAAGDKIDIETVDGTVKLKIPAGTQSGTYFKVKGKGVPRLNGSGRGDQLVRVVVNIPKGLSKKQAELLKELGI